MNSPIMLGAGILFILFLPAILSPIIWYSTKDPNNKWLKRVYAARFIVGLLLLIQTVYSAITYEKPPETPAQYLVFGFLGAMVPKLLLSWLLMRKWVKPAKNEA